MLELKQSKDEERKQLCLSSHFAEVETSIGRVYLYPLRVRDLIQFEQQESEEALFRVRSFLPHIASLALESDEKLERVPVSEGIIKSLSDGEIEKISEAYVQSHEWQKDHDVLGEHKPIARQDGETAVAYLVRLLLDEVEIFRNNTKIFDKRTPVFGFSLLDQVRKSTSALGSALREYEQFTRIEKPLPLDIQPARIKHLDLLQAQAEQAQARSENHAEKMELARLTGKMTAESAKTLKGLAEAATTLMERFEKRDRKTDKTTRMQITIAVWSVGISAVLALLSLIFSGLGYFHDRENAVSGELWQEKLLTVLEEGNRYRTGMDEEVYALREQVMSLLARIAELEASQRGDLKTVEGKSRSAPASSVK